jgi:hypothetical protein
MFPTCFPPARSTVHRDDVIAHREPEHDTEYEQRLADGRGAYGLEVRLYALLE